MRILQICPGYHPAFGGIEWHVQTLSECLVQQGHSVTVATMAHNKSLPRFEVIHGVELRRFSALGPRAYRIPIGLFRYLRQYGPSFEVLHAHNYHSLPLLLTVIAGRNRTIISPYYHGRGHTFTANILHQVYTPLAITCLQWTTRVICLSSGEADQVTQKLMIDRERITIIPSGVRLPRKDFIPEVEEQQHTLLSVGRLEGYKRLERIIAALPYLPQSFNLTIVGVGPALGRLEQYARRLAIHQRVHFLGRLSDEELQNLYRQAKVVISFSEAESFGLTILEALASGCQVVCSDIPAFRDFAREFPNMVFPVSSKADDKQVATTIQSVASKPRQIVNLQRYNWERIVTEHVRIYHSVANRG